MHPTKPLMVLTQGLVILLIVSLALGFQPNATHEEFKRQCVWNPDKNGSGDWVCDDKLPTLGEIVQRFQDGSNGGRALSSNVAWFYTGLGGPLFMQQQWCLGWLKSRSLTGYCSIDVLQGNGKAWKRKQESAFISQRAAFVQRYGVDFKATWLNCWCQATSVAVVNPDAYLFVSPPTPYTMQMENRVTVQLSGEVTFNQTQMTEPVSCLNML